MAKAVGKVVDSGVGWLQTDKAVHQKWVKLSIKQPTASALMHFFCGRMKANEAFVAPIDLLADELGVHRNTVKNALKYLSANNWIQIVNLGNGQANAYVVNSRVAWQTGRNGLRFALFNAVVMASEKDQDGSHLSNEPLLGIPTIRRGERQLPSGDGEPPPSQQDLEGVDLPDLPTIDLDRDEIAAIEEIEGRNPKQADWVN